MPASLIRRCLGLLLSLLPAAAWAQCPARLYVNAAAAAGGTGASWATAYASLGEALYQASQCTGGSMPEIWVAQGTYLPTRDASYSTSPADPRDRTFRLPDGVRVLGGFIGTETLAGERVSGHLTVLSGDFSGNDVVSGNGITLSVNGNGEDAYHVLLSSGSTGSTLDGVTVRGGNANGGSVVTVNGYTVPRESGAGLYHVGGPLTLSGCVFTANASSTAGGGLLSLQASALTLTSCVFSTNISRDGGGALINAGTATLSNCVFVSNSAAFGGGGLAVVACSPTLTNCSLASNTSTNNLGGGVYYTSDAGGTMRNCLLWQNVGGPSGKQNIYKAGTSVALLASYSTVQDFPLGGIQHVSDFHVGTTDPGWVNVNNPAGADNVWGTADDGLGLRAGAPAIDAGDPALTTPTTDLTGYQRAGTLDQGAYEYESLANLHRLYVRAGLPASGLGDRWATAYTSLGEALYQASQNAGITEIWVAQGTYLPTRDAYYNASPADPRDRTFRLPDGVQVLGGFVGGEATAAGRTSGHVTVLSGDFSGNDVVSGSGSTLSLGNYGENAYHVLLRLYAGGVAPTLDGVTVRGGNADGSGSVSLGSYAVLRNRGGGLACYDDDDATLTNCVFTANSSSTGGGALFSFRADLSLTTCAFIGNYCSSNGGAVVAAGASPTLSTCVFFGNKCVNSGSSLYFTSPASPVLTACTLVGNSAGNGAVYFNTGTGGTVRNCLLWQNQGGPSGQRNITRPSPSGPLTVSYSTVQDAGLGIPNATTTAISTADPLLVDATSPYGPDGLLGTADDGLALQAGSPAIDAGDPALTILTTDLPGLPRQGVADQGAYEFTPTLAALSTPAELPGMPLTLTGTGFSAASTVRFGGVAAGSVTYNSPTSLTVTVPAALPAGTVPVAVSTGTASGLTTAALQVLEVYGGGTVGACAAALPATATVADGQWHYLLSNAGQVVLAYKYTGTNLGSFSAEVQRANPAQPVRRDGKGLAYLDRNFHLTASGGRFDGRTVQLRLYGLATELTRLQAADPAATASALNVTQYSGPNEDCDLANNHRTGDRRTLAAPASGTPVGASWFVSELTVSDHFSEFYLTSSPVPLPVQLVSFTAAAQGSTVALAWRTASEVNSARFEVERSTDGATFGRLGEVAAASSSTTARTYAWFDAHPLPGRAYYRLRQIDQDGTATISPVRMVTLAPAGLSLYPNPTRATCTLTGAPTGAAAQVLDALGRVALAVVTDEAGTATITGLKPGVYVVRCAGQTRRLVVE